MSSYQDYADAVSRILQEQGQARAQGQLRSGDAWAGLGHQIAQLPDQLQRAQAADQEQKLRDQQIASNKALENERVQQTTERQRKVDQQKTFDHLMQAAYTPDPQTGIIGFNRQVLEQGMVQAGQGSEYLTLAPHLDAMEERARAMAGQRRALTAETIYNVEQAGNSLEALMLGGGFLLQNHAITKDHLDVVMDAARSNPEPAFIGKLMQQLGGSLPEYRKLKEDEAAKKAALEHQNAQTAGMLAQVPGQQAQSQIQQLQAAGMQGGLTPDQQRQQEQAAATAATARGQLDVARAREARENRAQGQTDALFAGGGQTGATPTLAPGQRNETFLGTIPTPLADKVKALVEGRIQLPTRFTKGDTYWQSLLDAAVKYDPSFDAVNYNSRSKARQDFTSGKSAQTVNALNTVAQHLERLSTSADALNNSWSPTYNSVANYLSRQSGSKIVTNFETDKKAVVDELTRAWRQAGGTEADIKSWSSVLDAANSPTQLHGAIAEMGGLLEGKLSALENQYQQGMGTDQVKAITPQARGTLDRLARKGGNTPATTTDAAAAPQQRAIPGVPGGVAESTDGGKTWHRVK